MSAPEGMRVAGTDAWSNKDRQAEIDGLRHSLLPLFLPGGLLAGWFWFYYGLVRDLPLAAIGLPAVVIWLGAGAGLLLRRRSYALACWSLLLCLLAAAGLIAAYDPGTMSLGLSMLTVWIAAALLGPRGSFLAATLLWVGITLSQYLSTGSITWDWATRAQVLFYYAAWVTAWLSTRPLRTLVEWTLTGWDHAQTALLEARERRGQLNRVIHALEESTARIERMNQELIQARREAEIMRALKARFAATVSHELRGPLNLILGFGRLMALSPERYGQGLSEAYYSDIDAIYRNTQHLSSLIDDILDLSQAEAERLALVKEPVDLERDIVIEAVETVRPLAERKGLCLRTDLAGDLPLVLADEVRLRQVLLNLLSNAVRLSDEGGVTVRTLHREELVEVVVEDTGPGIPEEEMANLFQEFHQVRRGAGREEAGSGLGLSISRHLVHLHGGEIWASSKVGVGTTFHFTIPLPGTAPLQALMVHTEGGPQPQAAQESCLIVHGDPGVIRVLGRHIEGLRVVGLLDVSQTTAYASRVHPRAIITTTELAGAVEAQLAAAPYDVPVISCLIPSLEDQLQAQNVIGYLIKPVSPEGLAALMAQVAPGPEPTVLLVDDEPDAVRMLEATLTTGPRTYRLLRAYSGRGALQLMETTVPDVVLLDWFMPEIDGEEVLRRMQEDQRLAGVPVVIVSARDRFGSEAALSTPIQVRCKRPLGLLRGAHCLQAIIQALKPQYLPEPILPASSAPEPRARSASGARQRPPEQGPVGAD